MDSEKAGEQGIVDFKTQQKDEDVVVLYNREGLKEILKGFLKCSIFVSLFPPFLCAVVWPCVRVSEGLPA